ncbi:MAG: proline dehydrogenase [Cytophagales bacterium]|nr:MAG: proline dehydrogenase [Cytophagales bacterium]
MNISFENTAIAFSAKNKNALRQTYWLFWAMNNPALVSFGTKMLKIAFQYRFPLVRSIVKRTLFAHFCGGENIEDCNHTIKQLAAFKIGAILDYSVEGEKEEQTFDATAEEIVRTVLAAQKQREEIPFAVFKVTGLANSELLEKIQLQQPLSNAEEQAWQKVKQRVEKICQTAHEYKVKILIDAEETWIQAPIDELAYMMMEKFNREEPIVYNTYQMYLKKSLGNLKQAYQTAETQGYHLGAKLVRGAYMEKERARASKMNYEDPIQPNKASSDNDFDAALLFCVTNLQNMGLCAGTHNEASSLYLAQLMQTHQISTTDKRIFFAQLYGMSDHISYNLANAGYLVAKYVPYGPVASVMPYLFRRAEENTSVAGQSSREFRLVQQEWSRRQKQK